jgi:hypothetical protein
MVFVRFVFGATRRLLNDHLALPRLLASPYDHADQLREERRVPLRGIPVWLLLAIAFVAGTIFLAVAPKSGWDFGLIHEIGVAFIVASVLGLTIDFTLKTQVAEDVFKATLGHILRPEFRAEVARITSYKFLCEQHMLLVEIELLPDHIVRVTTSIERTHKNITAYPEKIRAYLHIDDWGFAAGPSKIINCDMIKDGQTFQGISVEAEPFREKWQTEEVEIAPGKTFKSFSKYQEYRRNNDVVSYYFGSPTQNPEIEVRLPPELECSIGFGSASLDIERFAYANRSRLTGMYFPHQAMNIRWWPKVTS